MCTGKNSRAAQEARLIKRVDWSYVVGATHHQRRSILFKQESCSQVLTKGDTNNNTQMHQPTIRSAHPSTLSV